MEEEKLKLSKYELLCVKFEENPENTQLLDEIQEFLSKLVIREYIPLKEKEYILMDVLRTINKDFDVPGVVTFLEIGKLTLGLIKYCVNLENDLGPLNIGHFVVDTFYKYGLYDAIISKCEKDCNRLFKMIDESMNVSNIYRLLQTISLFDQKSYDDWLKSMKDLKDTLDSKTLQEVLDVLNEDNEGNKELIDSVKKVAIESANKEMETEALKFKKVSEVLSKQQENEVVEKDSTSDERRE